MTNTTVVTAEELKIAAQPYVDLLQSIREQVDSVDPNFGSYATSLLQPIIQEGIATEIAAVYQKKAEALWKEQEADTKNVYPRLPMPAPVFGQQLAAMARLQQGRY